MFGDFGATQAHMQQTANVLARNIEAKRKKKLTSAEASALSVIVQRAYAEVMQRNVKAGTPLTSAQEDDGARQILKVVASKYGVVL